nr:xylulose kinase-1 [Tanacetum cinerariifolium]
YKGKEIAKPITPPYESAFKEDSDHEQAQRDKDMQKNLALTAKYFKKIYKPTNNNLRTSSNSMNKNVDTTLRYKNDNQSGQFGNQKTVNVAGARENECRKPKRVKDSTYHKEKMLLYKQDEKGVPLQAEQYDFLADTDEEIDEQDSEAHYIYMEKIQEMLMKTKRFKSKLKKANTTLAQELKECKTILAETSKTLVESNSVWDRCLVALQNKQTEFEKYKAFNDRIVNYDKLEQIFDNAWIKRLKDQFRAPTAQDMKILIQTCLMPLALNTHNDSFIFVHELKQEMHVDLKYVESLEKVIDELESDKAEFSNMYDMILQECVPNEVMCSYLLSLYDLDALAELQCLYLHKVKECDCLAQKLSKQTEYVIKEVHTKRLQCFAKVEKHSISLEIALQKCKEQTLPQIARQAINNTNVLRPGMYRIDNRFYIVDSRCTKHMTGNLKLLCNFVEKFLGLKIYQGPDLNKWYQSLDRVSAKEESFPPVQTQTLSKPMTSQSAFSFPDQSSFSTQQATFNSFSPGQTYNISEPVTTSQPNPQTSTNFQNQQFQQYHIATLSSNNAKFPYLKKDEYETETKARILLLQSLPEDHIADFHHLDDAREIWLAVKARFGGVQKDEKNPDEAGVLRVHIIEDVLHSFVAKKEPTQQLAYEDFEQVDQLEMEELDIKQQMAMLLLRINKFQKKAGRKINFNNKD